MTALYYTWTLKLQWTRNEKNVKWTENGSFCGTRKTQGFRLHNCRPGKCKELKTEDNTVAKLWNIIIWQWLTVRLRYNKIQLQTQQKWHNSDFGVKRTWKRPRLPINSACDERYLNQLRSSVLCGKSNYTVNRKKHTKMFLSYLPQNLVDSDKKWYTLSWINLRYSNFNVLERTWIMSLHYLMKLSVRVL